MYHFDILYRSGVASAGSVLVSNCKQIFMDPDATFMIHHSRTVDKFGNLIIKKDEEDIIYWMEKTNQSYEIIEYLVKNEVVFDAVTAKKQVFIQNLI